MLEMEWLSCEESFPVCDLDVSVFSINNGFMAFTYIMELNKAIILTAF